MRYRLLALLGLRPGRTRTWTEREDLEAGVVKPHVLVVLLAGVLVGLILAVPWVVTRVAGQTCDQTISPGTNLATTIQDAATGVTICLNSGSYGSVSMSGVSKSPRVTVRSATGQGASFSLTTSNGTNGLTFDSVTLTSWGSSGATTRDLTVKNTRFTGATDLGMTGAVNANILIDNCTFINLNQGSREGRVSVWQVPQGTQSIGVTISNSLFENLPPYNVGESDGIQVGAYGLVIGPGNTFRGFQQASNFVAHVDAIQGYGQRNTTITGNLFIDNAVNIGIFDSGNTETITHNVIVLGPNGIRFSNNVFLSIGPNGTITHNTFKDVNVGHGAKAGHTPNSNHLWQDNIFVNANLYNYGSGGNGSCAGCNYNNNLFDATSPPRGTNQLLGSPTFIGGSNPPTWPGYKLTSASLGYQAAVSPASADVGTNVFPGDPPPAAPTPAAPTNLRISKMGR